MLFSDESIAFLRGEISRFMSGYRLEHTLGVERMAARLGELFCPENIDILRVASLLHDITKENTFEKQLQICEKFGIIIPYSVKMSPKILHSITAAAIIPQIFPQYAQKDVLSAVRWHTTGKEDMNIIEKIIYLADYIEDGRRFDDCVLLRNYFFSVDLEKMNVEERSKHLNETLVISFDMTIKQLLSEKMPVDAGTIAARNYLLYGLSEQEALKN